MKRITTLLLLLLLISCGGGGNQQTDTPSPEATLWDNIKANTLPHVILSTEFNTPTRLASVGTLAWEDGLYISDDGLTIFSFYLPADILKWVEYIAINPFCPVISNHIRGPILMGTDLDLSPPADNNPWGCNDGVLHSDIAYATRNSINEPFSNWSRHSLSNDFIYDGGFVSSQNPNGTYDIVFSRSNDPNLNDIYWVRNTGLTPVTPTPISISATINSDAQEDNPHLERVDPDHLILLFDNHGIGAPDTQISYSISHDNGSNWTTPQLMSINSPIATEDLQGHLYQDASNDWWLYFVSNRDGSLDIFRSQHSDNDVINNFDSWETPEKVISGGTVSDGFGTIAAVGEPSLTSSGDLYFAVVYCKNPEDQTSTDSCDIDPWVTKRKSD